MPNEAGTRNVKCERVYEDYIIASLKELSNWALAIEYNPYCITGYTYFLNNAEKTLFSQDIPLSRSNTVNTISVEWKFFWKLNEKSRLP